MHIYIHEHQTELIPAGLDPADVADTVQEPSLPFASQTLADYVVGEGDDTAPRACDKDETSAGCIQYFDYKHPLRFWRAYK